MNSTEAAIICSSCRACRDPRCARLRPGAEPSNEPGCWRCSTRTTLPRAMPGGPRRGRNCTENHSSGAEVPKATMVSDTISAGMPIPQTRGFTALFTRLSPSQKQITRGRAHVDTVHIIRGPLRRGTGPLPILAGRISGRSFRLADARHPGACRTMARTPIAMRKRGDDLDYHQRSYLAPIIRVSSSAIAPCAACAPSRWTAERAGRSDGTRPSDHQKPLQSSDEMTHPVGPARPRPPAANLGSRRLKSSGIVG